MGSLNLKDLAEDKNNRMFSDRQVNSILHMARDAMDIEIAGIRQVRDLPACTVEQVMTKNPKAISHRALAAYALAVMERYLITILPVVGGLGTYWEWYTSMIF